MIDLATIATLEMPPERYDHKPTRIYSVQYVSHEELKRFCPEPEGYILVGCTVLMRYVLIREDMTPEAKAKVLRHELGHVNGWKH